MGAQKKIGGRRVTSKILAGKQSEKKLITVSRAVRGKWWMCDAH